MNIDLVQNKPIAEIYLNIVEAIGYRLLNKATIENATRKTDATATVIDHILTNIQGKTTCEVSENTFSDHNTIYVQMEVSEKRPKMQYRQLRQVNQNKINPAVTESIERVKNVEELIKFIQFKRAQNIIHITKR